MTGLHEKKFAVIGNPVAHSRSPFIHEQFARQTGIPLRYDKILAGPDEFADTVRRFFSSHGAGLNVTVPFKEEAWALAATGLSARARLAGAVNTLWMEGGQLRGCNTDGIGLLDDLRRLGVDLQDKNILVLGAGGAARGIVFPLLDAGCARLAIANRTAARAADLCRIVARQRPLLAARLSASGLAEITGTWDLVINATSSSLDGAPPDLPEGLYAPEALAYDLVYSAARTPFMEQALARGASRAADGLGMLVSQAAASFAIWNGRAPDAEPVLALLRQHISRA